MYKIISSLFISLITSATLLTAQTLSVNNDIIKFEEKGRAAIKIEFQVTPKKSKHAFKDFMEDQKGVDVDGLGFLTNKDILSVKAQTIADISLNKMDLYAKFKANEKNTEMWVFGSFGYDIFINPQDFPKEYKKMRLLVYAFLDDFLPDYYQEKVEEAAELVGDIKEDKEDTKDALQNNLEEIEKLKKENATIMRQLKEYETQLVNAKAKLNARKSEQKEIIRKTVKDQ